MIVLNGTSEFEQFGYSFDLTKQPEQIIIAVASVTKEAKLDKSPIASDLKNAGIVQLFNLNKTGYPVVAVLKSDRSFSDFGSRVKVKKNLIQKI